MKKVATLSMLSFCMFTNDSEGFSAPPSANPQINSRVQTLRKAATIGDDDNINMKQRVASENFLEANKDTITEKGSRRKFFGQVVKGSIGVAGIAVAEHGLGCACAQCIAEFEHGVGCACTGCGQAAKMTKARFGVKAAMAYERDVGGEFASPDTKAFNIQVSSTSASMEMLL